MASTGAHHPEEELDDELVQSFPASDPPAWSGTTATPGNEPAPHPPARTSSAPATAAWPRDVTPNFAPLVLRLTLAAVIFPHGAQKALGLFGGAGLTGTIDSFGANFGVAPVLAVLVVAAEFLGPLALVLGLGTRFTALAIAAVMVGAIHFVHGANGFFMNWSGQQVGEGFEFHLLVLGIALALMLGGAGRWSLDARLRDTLRRRRRSS